MRSRPGRTVGEDSGILKTFAGIVLIICTAFGVMAVFAFKVLPWSKPEEQAAVVPAAPAAQPPVVAAAPAPAAPPAVAPAAPAPVQAPEAPPDGLQFADLYNGRDLTGWQVIGERSNWDVDSSRPVLMTTGQGDIGWLLTNQAYADFVMTLEYQAERGANSGIAVLGSPAEFHQLEIQLVNCESSSTGGMWFPTGKGFSYLPPQQSVQEKPANEWNSLEIELRARRLKITANGTAVSQFDLAELSRQKDGVPALKRTTGSVGLQSHHSVVRFRNVRIAEIATPEKS